MSSTLTKKSDQVNARTLFVGIDMALKRNVAQVVGARGEKLERFGFANDREGYDYFHRRLEGLKARHQASEVLIGMEPTNYFWKLLATDLERRQESYRLVNSYTVKKHREGDQLDRSKDDQRDAFTIADLLRCGKYTKSQLLHGRYAELRHHVVLYDRLRGDLRRQKTLIHNLAHQLFPELSQVFKDIGGVTVRAMLRHHAAASVIRQMSAQAFIAGVRADLRGRCLMVSKLRRVYRLAHISVGLQHGVQGLQRALYLHLETLEMLQQQLAEVESVLLDTFRALPESRYLLSIPALGVFTAAIILAEIGDPSHFSNGRQLIKLAGTQPVPNTSGRRIRSRTPMSRKGRPRLRTALFFAVMRLVYRDTAFAREYRRLQRREKNPLTKMEALGALMNKLLRILWSLMHNQRYYNPDLVSRT